MIPEKTHLLVQSCREPLVGVDEVIQVPQDTGNPTLYSQGWQQQRRLRTGGF
ncbi:MAG: hypothetical protein V9G10_13440 [Candidatus Nanopelagicales bacterium]